MVHTRDLFLNQTKLDYISTQFTCTFLFVYKSYAGNKHVFTVSFKPYPSERNKGALRGSQEERMEITLVQEVEFFSDLSCKFRTFKILGRVQQ